MNYRKFGTTELVVSEVGFGAWAIGGAAKVGSLPIGWGHTDDQESIEALQIAFEKGINFFDTADFYGLGHSEELIGKVFGSNDKVLIGTKVGQKPGREKPVDIDYSKDYVFEACESSLRRLRRNSIDYYQLHVANTEHLKQGECIEAMNKLQQQGKIRYWGISLSTYNPFPEAAYMLENKLGHGFQLAFNVINQKPLSLLSDMHQKGYGIIARMPLQFGLLSGKFSPGVQFDETDHRSFRLTPAIIEQANSLLKHLDALTEKYQVDKASLALSFILSFDEISTVIPGIRTPDQALRNSENLVKLLPEERQLIVAMYQPHFLPLLKQIQVQG